MTKQANIPAIETTTGKLWEEWIRLLDAAYERMPSTLNNPGWWAQAVAVAYEQHIGRRQPGQRADGTYEATATKTLTGTMDDALATWLASIQGKTEFAGVAMSGEPTTSANEKHHHWAVNLTDGSRLNVDTYPKTEGKALLALTHAKLPDATAAERWRTIWKNHLEQL